MDRPLAVQESSGPPQSLAAIGLRALDWRASGGKEPARTFTSSQQLRPQHDTGNSQSRNPEAHRCWNWNNSLATRWGVSEDLGVNNPPRNANRITATSSYPVISANRSGTTERERRRTILAPVPQVYSGWKACSGFATGLFPLQYGDNFLSCAMIGGTAAITRSTSSCVL